APGSPLEHAVAAIWAEVLQLERVGVHDNFLELGGDSLRATQILARIRAAFGGDVPLREMFAAQTVAEQAAALARCQVADGPGAVWARAVDEPGPSGGRSLMPDNAASTTPLSRRRAKGPCPPSFAQERLWFFDQFEPRSPVYHIARALHLDGPLDLGALQAALDMVAARHEAIRTSLETVDGRPVPRVAAAGPIPLARVDLESGALTDSEAVAQLVAEDARRPFDLSRDLMLRATLFRLGADRHILLFVMHHIASDG